MKITFEKLGVITKGEIALNNFTIFCGENNTGKTYAMYAIYGLLGLKMEENFSFIPQIIEEVYTKGFTKVDLQTIFEQHFPEMLQKLEQSFVKKLPDLFSASVDEAGFKSTKIKIEFDKEKLLKCAYQKNAVQRISQTKEDSPIVEINKGEDSFLIDVIVNNSDFPKRILERELSEFIVGIVFSNGLKNRFLLPAERAGLNLFHRDLTGRKLALFEHLKKDKIDLPSLIKDVLKSRYPEPIADYLAVLNDIVDLKKETGDFSELVNYLQKKIIKGTYSIDADGGVYFKPERVKNKMSLHLASSAVKSLFGVWFYLKHLAKQGDCLMIDEPELNLHPDNQRQVARFLARLVNAGLKAVVSTHSDYFMTELNNLMMLQKDFSEKTSLMKKYGYEADDLLKMSQVSAYFFNEKEVKPMEKDDEEGIIIQSFNKASNALNSAANEIYFASQEG